MGVYIGMKDHTTGEEIPEWFDYDGKWGEFLAIDFEKGGVEFDCFGEIPESSMDHDDRSFRPKSLYAFQLLLMEEIKYDFKKAKAMVDILRANKNASIWYSY
jgi:hypothetical protein|tara:strand:- start:7065 stop:7370 length:306 start_codon:yes stop_codon:yes gene_type:complete